MEKERVTVYLNKAKYGRFKKLCDKLGFKYSKKIEMLIDESLKQADNGKNK